MMNQTISGKLLFLLSLPLDKKSGLDRGYSDPGAIRLTIAWRRFIGQS
jgi:hypothetical protein